LVKPVRLEALETMLASLPAASPANATISEEPNAARMRSRRLAVPVDKPDLPGRLEFG